MQEKKGSLQSLINSIPLKAKKNQDLSEIFIELGRRIAISSKSVYDFRRRFDSKVWPIGPPYEWKYKELFFAGAMDAVKSGDARHINSIDLDRVKASYDSPKMIEHYRETGKFDFYD